MRAEHQAAVRPDTIEIALLVLSLLWYWSFAVLFSSGTNGLDGIPWSWLVVLAFGPLFSAALAVALHLALRHCGRAVRPHEILLVVFVVPQFLGWIYVWLGLLHYMGFS
jgi:hypothetical protein